MSVKWNLTTPGMASDPYDEVRVERIVIRPESRRLSVQLQYGKQENGSWVPGRLPVGKVGSITIDGSDYAGALETQLDTLTGQLLAWMSNKGLLDDGTTG